MGLGVHQGKFQSTLPAWGETYLVRLCVRVADISIHSPRMGRDIASIVESVYKSAFQSTLPVWGETVLDTMARVMEVYFNPLSPYGERPACDGANAKEIGNFNPLSPYGERPSRSTSRTATRYFNPLSPYGERPWEIRATAAGKRFQSTLPVWGETCFAPVGLHGLLISIHSPRMGRDEQLPAYLAAARISIHSPRMGRDGARLKIFFAAHYFNPLSPYGERRRRS